MDFSNLLQLAKENKDKPTTTKCFSTIVTPAKKPPRSNVPSVAVQKFLQKKEQEERKKEEAARRQKEQLLSLRAANSKNNKAAKLMASRTKDNDFSRIRLTEDEVEIKQKMEAEMRRQMLTDKVERMKARIKFQEHEQALPHKRKRKAKAEPDDKAKAAKFEEEWNMLMKKKVKEKPAKKKAMNKGPQKPLSFNELLQLASDKQHEPETEPPQEDLWEDFEEDEEEFASEQQQPQRPMTKLEKIQLMEEQLHRAKLKVLKDVQRGASSSAPNSQPKGAPPRSAPEPNGVSKGRVFPTKRTMNDQRANKQRASISNEEIPSFSTIHTSKSVEQRNEDLFKHGMLKQKRGTRNLEAKLQERIPHKLENGRPAAPMVNATKKPVSNNRTDVRQAPVANRAQEPKPGQTRKPPSHNARTASDNPYRNAKLSHPVQSDEYDPSSPGINSSYQTAKSTLQDSKRPPRLPESRPSPLLPEPRRPPAIPEPRKTPLLPNSKRPPLLPDSKRPPLLPESRKQPSLQDSRKPPSLANAKRPPPLPKEQVQPSAAMRNKVPAGVSPDNMRPARFNETANEQRKRPAPVGQKPGSHLEKAPKAAVTGSSQSRGPLRMPPRPGDDRFSSRGPPPPKKIMRHEAIPNLARNPYKKLPPITCSRPYRIESDDEEEEEDDDEMRDFIDDEPNNDIDYSKHIKEIFGYDKSKYLYAEDEYDDEVVESSFAEQMKEENRSARIALQEDYEELVKEMEEQKRKVNKKKLK